MDDVSSPDLFSAAAGSGAKALVTLFSGDFRGLEGRPVDVQVNVAERASPKFIIVGLPGKSTRESRDRIRTAIHNSGFEFPGARILVNLAPAAREKHGVGFDLPVALGILLASRQIFPGSPAERRERRLARFGLVGELGLKGELRPVRGALLIADSLRRRGVREHVVARENAREVALLDDVIVYAAGHLREAVAALKDELDPYERGGGLPESAERDFDDLNFSDVRGQEATKRGLLVAAAGCHNVLLTGPPGVGKTMLARRLPGILPPLELSEAMEVLRVRSALCGEEEELGLPRRRPFRAPHHTVSYAGLVGGGNVPQPGEVTRAHRGVLFLDEFPEFSRRVLEALREPLEAGSITVGRSAGSVSFPASFLLVAAMNPCPCGYLGHPRRPCACTPRLVESYRRRLSGPLTDRLDIFLDVGTPEPSQLLGVRRGGDLDSETMAERVARARQRQRARWGGSTTNGEVTLRRLLRREVIEPGALETLRRSAEKLSLSARGFARAVRVARTIADLEGSKTAAEPHVLEALQFRRGDLAG